MKKADFSQDILVKMIEAMILIRRVEEKISELYQEQEMKCPIHLSIGQEASAVGVCLNLRKEDYVFSNHRCHSHYLAKGGDLKRMIAELYGKKTGCCAGKGGSMHLVDQSVGFVGASSIVAGQISIAVGSAFAFKLRKEKRLSVVFFGDGATEEGVFYESLNFAALKKLPVIFICENNGIAVESPLSVRQAKENISSRGKIFGVPGFRVNGQNVLEVFAAAKKATERCLNGNGPSLIECKVERWSGHVSPKYKISDNCPIKLFGNIVSDEQLRRIKERVDNAIQEAFEFAKKAHFPLMVKRRN